MKKNPFKAKSVVDTLINVGIGGAANVIMDYAFAQVDALASLGDTTKNAVKIAAGALVGSMAENKYLRAATDGIATVGVSNLIASYIVPEATAAETTSTSGAPFIGRIRNTGNRSFKTKAAVKGAAGVPFMS